MWIRVRRQRTAYESHVQAAKDSLAEIDAIGVQVKDIETGLLDFPCLIDGETVLLCWKLGESRIEFWHTLDAGFRGRQPLDERFTKKPARIILTPRTDPAESYPLLTNPIDTRVLHIKGPRSRAG